MVEESLRTNEVFIENELKSSFLSYAMSVIVSRALPEVRDGLKPVHRRIIYAMNELGNYANKPHKKCARIVGEVIGKYHPHGDTAVYDAMVRLAQDFNMRYPLVNGQGNFGSIDGDNAAAMRYCISGDTLILTKNGLVPINTLSNKKDTKINETILSIDNKQNKAIKFFNSGKHKTIKLETKHGFEIEGSYNHPVFCFDNDGNIPKFKWKLLEKITSKDIIVLNRNSLFPTTNIKLEKFHPKLKKNEIEFKLPKILNEDLAFILGALVAEGSFHQNKILFSNQDMKYYNKVKSCIKNQFKGVKLYEREISGNCIEFTLHNQQIVNFFINIGLLNVKSDKKEVPFTILKSLKNIQKIFLQSLFEGDGSVSHRIDSRHGGESMEVTYNSKSKILIKQLKIVLLNFGIDTSKPYLDKRNDCLKLQLTNVSNISKFLEKIGFFSNRKNSILKNVRGMNEGLNKNDTIPFISNYLKKKYKNWRLNKFNFDRYSSLEKNLNKLKEIVDKDDFKILQNLLKQKYLFSKVKRIEKIKTKKEVYSIKVNSLCHSFVANGFINHNTEAKMTKLTEKFLQDIDKDTVKFRLNFDDSLEEPEVLPTLIPALLVNGSSGIAVGMATNIPPHNLGEILDAAIEMINNPNQSVEELVSKGLVKGPDFPTGALMLNKSGIQEIYVKGEGAVTMKAICSIEEQKKNREAIIIEEIPYQVNKVNLINQIVDLVKNGKIKDISDIRDESNKKGIRVVIETKRDSDPNIILNQLYKFTNLQMNFNARLLAIVGGVPTILNLKTYLMNFIAFRKEVIVNRTKYDLKKSEERMHILEGLKIALDSIDSVIALIKASKSGPEAKEGLMSKYGLSEIQSQAILDLKLQKLTGLEMEKIRIEYNEILETIKKLNFILDNSSEQYKIIKFELEEIRTKFADERKTKIIVDEGSMSIEDLIKDEDFVVMNTQNDYIKKVPLEQYRTQKRGGKGINANFKGEDTIKNLFVANSKDTLFIFGNDGSINWLKTYEVPTINLANKGRPIINYIDLRGRRITNLINIANMNEGYLIFLTKKGIIKKTEVKNFSKPRNGGIKAINLDEGDSVLSVVYSKEGKSDIIIESNVGLAIRFTQENLSVLGRVARGVKAMKLRGSEEVVGIELAEVGKTLLTVTQKGFGKRTLLSDYPTIKRAGRGVIDIKTDDRNGKVITMNAVGENDELFIMTKKKIVRTSVSDFRIISRNTKGVKVVNLDDDDEIVSVEKIVHDADEIKEE